MTLLAPRDAALRLSLSTSRLAQLDREGRLPALRDSADRRLYYPEDVDRFVVARRYEASRRNAASESPPGQADARSTDAPAEGRTDGNSSTAV